eukprot:CAMPEP_0176440034 /NCGR_PEP_ID=MMETSP0127-20121128/20320_1 /TAXON_ID=938130 /ORGANISM="Platyophrya macrostoma, Strain WH" /LENGTH=112 /DNA_ID=CAMNT_0017824461 /DNA_START=105 /DNA_END=440 /DNA_ORIENTATION=-
MTLKQRVIGWAICTILGILISMMSMFALFGVISGNGGKFAVTYTLGQICSLAGTMFLMGPMRQLKSMCAKVRIFATILYIGLMILTIVFAVVLEKNALALVCAIAQWFAYMW